MTSIESVVLAEIITLGLSALRASGVSRTVAEEATVLANLVIRYLGGESPDAILQSIATAKDLDPAQAALEAELDTDAQKGTP